MEIDMENRQTVKMIIYAPDAHQLLRSVRAIESIATIYVEGKVCQNNQQDGVHTIISFPLNWFEAYETAQLKRDEQKYSAEPNSQEQPCRVPRTLNFNLTEGKY
jgi:hypothetical protein